MQDSIVDEIYGPPRIQLVYNFSDKAIQYPKNNHSLQLNEQTLRKFPGDMKRYFNVDTIICGNEKVQ